MLREIAYGKAVIWLDSCKKLFLFLFNTTTSRHRIKLSPCYVEAQGPNLSFKVPFVKIGAADWTLPGDSLMTEMLCDFSFFTCRAATW